MTSSVNSGVTDEFPVAPQRALVDTGVIIRALGDRPQDPSAASCRDLWHVLLRHKTEILVAAPSVAEMLRAEPKTTLPRTRNIEVVPFDQNAAYNLAEKLPLAVLKAEQQTTGLPLNYIKYDALIVACALRHRAEVLISIDAAMLSLAASAGLRAYAPSHFDRLSALSESKA